ncbi:MAG: hypothetical protein OXT09_25745 [Myxococcales bacterium]|nr:hypothetical protein [Myxococcales bacterium]
MGRSRLAWGVLSAFGLLFACERGSDALAQAAADAEPHLERFGRFDGWARRASSGNQVLPEGEAIGETIFAPVRNDRRVLAAWVTRGGSRGRTYTLPDAVVVPEPTPWVSLRTAELGPLRVWAPERCPIDLPRWWRGETDAHPCVLLQREKGELTVTVAFAPDREETGR